MLQIEEIKETTGFDLIFWEEEVTIESFKVNNWTKDGIQFSNGVQIFTNSEMNNNFADFKSLEERTELKKFKIRAVKIRRVKDHGFTIDLRLCGEYDPLVYDVPCYLGEQQIFDGLRYDDLTLAIGSRTEPMELLYLGDCVSHFTPDEIRRLDE